MFNQIDTGMQNAYRKVIGTYENLLHYIRGMIKRFSARYTSSHYSDIYTRYVDTYILLKNTEVTRGFIPIK
jgi:hypothetical protein